MARLVLDKFGDLTDSFASPHARRKVLAGIVMTTGNRVSVCPLRVLTLNEEDTLSVYKSL